MLESMHVIVDCGDCSKKRVKKNGKQVVLQNGVRWKRVEDGREE